uniref:Uncharacterized protein n=1 Tax=Avena sativa TaxID=4498 RepID=A0ACD5TKI7_AVESA
METVILPRSTEIVAAEGALRWALVAFVSGQRSSISLIEAGAAVAARVPRAEDNFTVHRSWPADFLVVCSSRRVRDDVMAAGVVDGRGFSLRFSPWNRQLQAVRRPLRYRAHLELTGIPPHAWNRTTAVALLGSAAWIERLGASTANREDLGHFREVAWIDNISHLPPEKALLIEEPDDLMEEDEGLVLPGDALIPLEKLMLRYIVKIRLVRAEDMTAAEHDFPPGDRGNGDSDEEDAGRRDRGGGRDESDARGWPARGADARPRTHGSFREAHDGHGDWRGDGRGDAARRRRPSDVGWGRSRRVAIAAPVDASPWPEVDDEDVQEEEVGGPEEDVHGARAEQVFDKDKLPSELPLATVLAFDQEREKCGPHRMLFSLTKSGSSLGDSNRVEKERAAQPQLTCMHDKEAAEQPTVDRGKDVPTPFASCQVGPLLIPMRSVCVSVDKEEGAVVSEDSFSTRSIPADRGDSFQIGSDCQLHSPGLISPSDDVCWTVTSDQLDSPRSVLDRMDVFSVNLSSVDVDSDQQEGPEVVVASTTPMGTRGPATFRGACRQPINTVLSRPVAKRCRNKRKYSGPVRRSGRIRGRFAPGTPIRQQQRTLITRLGIAREGELIGDEALDAYLDLFARPLRQEHIDVVLRLFGWMPDALPLFDDAPVECLV